MADSNDSFLVQKTLDGDTESFRLLVERYKNALFNLAYRLTQNRDCAEDMAQEAFIRAYENLYKFDREKSFFTWLYTICMNLTINELKKRAHYQSGENWEKKYEKLDEVEQSIERKKKQELLHKLIDKMPVKYKAAVILRYQEELSYQEIADILHISVNLAKVRVHRGIEKLRAFLPEKDNEK